MAGAAELTRATPLARRRLIGPLAAATVVLLAALAPLVTTRQDILNLLFLVTLYVSLGQSWNILAGFAGQINLGHAAFFGIGATVTRALWFDGLPLGAALPLGGLAAAAFALLIGVPTFRLRGVYFSMGTLAVGEVLRITVSNAMPKVTALPAELIAGYDLAARYELCLGLAAATMLAAYALLRSRWSIGILAVREDEEAARSTGVNALQHKLLALLLSSFFAGLAGGVFDFHEVSYYPDNPFSPIWTFDSVLITFIGGVGTLIGPLIGAVFVVVIREQLAVMLIVLQVPRELADPIVQLPQVIFGALFIVVVLALPGGLVDIWARVRRGR